METSAVYKPSKYDVNGLTYYMDEYGNMFYNDSKISDDSCSFLKNKLNIQPTSLTRYVDDGITYYMDQNGVFYQDINMEKILPQNTQYFLKNRFNINVDTYTFDEKTVDNYNKSYINVGKITGTFFGILDDYLGDGTIYIDENLNYFVKSKNGSYVGIYFYDDNGKLTQINLHNFGDSRNEIITEDGRKLMYIDCVLDKNALLEAQRYFLEGSDNRTDNNTVVHDVNVNKNPSLSGTIELHDDDDGFVSYDAWGEGVVGDYNFEYNSEQMDYVIDELDKVIKDNDELIISIENEIDNMKNSGAWTGTVYDKFNEKCKFYTNNVLRDYVEILRQMKKNFETVRDNGKHIDDAVKSVKSNVTGD